MTGAGIFSGDTVIVDRSVKAVNGKIVIAVLNGEMLIRRFEKIFRRSGWYRRHRVSLPLM